MLAQAAHVGPTHAAVLGAEEAGRLDASVQPVSDGGQVPDARHGWYPVLVAVGESDARVRPRVAEVVAAPHDRSVPGTAGAGQEAAAAVIPGEVLDGHGLAEGSAQRADLAIGVELEGEGSLPSAQQDEGARCHRKPPLAPVGAVEV